MPSYPYSCDNDHSWDVFRAMKDDHGVKQYCPKCGSSGSRVYYPLEVSGSFTDKTREILSVPFGRKKASKFKRAEDVDKALADFDRRYKHFGTGASHPDKDLS